MTTEKKQSIITYLYTFFIFYLHFIFYRTILFVTTDKYFPKQILIKKALAGHLYDIHYILLILFLGTILHLTTSSSKIIKTFFLLSFLLTVALNIINYCLLSYFSDGLANLGILVEYLRDYKTVFAMGTQTFNPLPGLLMLTPVLLFFYKKYVFSTFSTNKKFQVQMLSVVLVLNLFVNQIVRPLRINKDDALECNTIFKIFKSQSDTTHIFNEVKKIGQTKLSTDDIRFVQNNPHATYLSEEYPLLKKDKLPSLNLISGKPNIVFIIFESVSAFQTGIKNYFQANDKNLFIQQPSLTPFFDSLLKKSLVLPNFYAHGTFTALGQVSLLCSIYDPISALDGQGSIMRNYYGNNIKCLPEYLNEIGYTNYFFNGYHKEFDNKASFFTKIKLDQLYCREEIKSAMNIKEDEHTWGLEDSTVLKFMSQTLKKTNKPFFSMFMSVNTHAPYNHIKNLPPNISKSNYALKKVDMALKDFFTSSEKEKWFNNTIFVFAADNGASFKMSNVSQKINEDAYFNRIPFAIYAPGFPKLVGIQNTTASQVDVAPTILNLINQNQTINHFVGKSIFNSEDAFTFQYKNFNNFFTIPDLGPDKVDRLRKLHMYFIFNNRFLPQKVPAHLSGNTTATH